MDFDSAITTINKLLLHKQPYTFNSTWILKHAPHVYRFIQKNIRMEISGIDWDRVTRALNRKFQRRWFPSSRGRTKLYRDNNEVQIILRKYNDKLYTFLTHSDKKDNDVRDRIIITLVRIAQRGNASAKNSIVDLVRLLIDGWSEHCPLISRWRGYDHLIEHRIECCIRCYRYSGSFIGYLFKTLKYAGRGIKPLMSYSLDDSLFSGRKRRGDSFGIDPYSGEIRKYC